MNIHLNDSSAAPPAIGQVELSQIDLRYQGHRLRQSRLEERLLSSIAQRGIQEPLEGVVLAQTHVLLNGFKRYRCALKLHLPSAPFLSLGPDELAAITHLLRISNKKPLSLLEQARFIDELKQTGGRSVGQIAEELQRSKAWVSMRLGLLAGMSPKVRDLLLAGSFPVYSYMYLMRQFMRMNSVKTADIEAFVAAVSGHSLSIREVERLAHGFFRGPKSFRQEILQGHLALALQQINQVPQDPDACTEFERIFIGDLECLQKCLRRVLSKSQAAQLTNRAFFAQAHLLTAELLTQAPALLQTLRTFHDRCGQA